ncbi:kinesin motor domain-containing protein [Cryptosporidium muris RN66]|uniref:Kinesin motor domain-containing protein n=1 Tax=Cryptosporidium muris (strain RN66) TaxID=441375 RepID=B6ADL5_CRYMR|nr:kinesin motor domain-containing protein [Cryptosporidium muris RN66]EEA06306.1 kinesin motor domain-containing protein [Cryptosporidium muris RN66]|eukprot:XP_002140655.1 kinesin motor domain-containing protein [Cryptosporidium muris RN66]
METEVQNFNQNSNSGIKQDMEFSINDLDHKKDIVTKVPGETPIIKTTQLNYNSNTPNEMLPSCSSSFRIAIRFRPPNLSEIDDVNYSNIWHLTNKSVVDLIKGNQYTFDHIYDESATNTLIFEELARDVVGSCLDGFNATIFAYGQTSSGKTHTMMGDSKGSYDGIIPLSISEIFKLVEERSRNNTQTDFVVSVSYLEVYNEKLVDLLSLQINSGSSSLSNESNMSKITIIDGIDGAVEFRNLTSRRVIAPSDIHEIISIGSRLRHVAETSLNERSSRSHTILRVRIESQYTNSSDICIGILNLVDLAGSESIRRTQVEGDRRKEGASINRSLLALSQVISQLSDIANNENIGDSNPKKQYINYRDSKITRILSDSLGGNSRTIIVCTCSPAKVNYYESISTLEFAERAKNIKNKIKVNILKSNDKSSQIFKLKSQIVLLQKQLSNLPLLNILEQENEILKKQQIELISQMEHLKLQLNNNRTLGNIDESENLQNIYKQNCSSCTTLKKDYDQMLLKYGEIIDNKSEEVKILQNDLEKAYFKSNVLKNYEEQNVVLEKKVKELKLSIKTQSEQIDKLSNQLLDRNGELQRIQSNLLVHEAMNENLHIKNKNLTNEKDHLIQIINSSIENIEYLVSSRIHSLINLHKYRYKLLKQKLLKYETKFDFQNTEIWQEICKYLDFMECYMKIEPQLTDYFSFSNTIFEYREYLEQMNELERDIFTYSKEILILNLDEKINFEIKGKFGVIIKELLDILEIITNTAMKGNESDEEQQFSTIISKPHSISYIYRVERTLSNVNKELLELQEKVAKYQHYDIEKVKLQNELKRYKSENEFLQDELQKKSASNKEMMVNLSKLQSELVEARNHPIPIQLRSKEVEQLIKDLDSKKIELDKAQNTINKLVKQLEYTNSSRVNSILINKNQQVKSVCVDEDHLKLHKVLKENLESNMKHDEEPSNKLSKDECGNEVSECSTQ